MLNYIVMTEDEADELKINSEYRMKISELSLKPLYRVSKTNLNLKNDRDILDTLNIESIDRVYDALDIIKYLYEDGVTKKKDLVNEVDCSEEYIE